MSPKIIYYYQTFCGLKNIEGVTHIHLAATHFGEDSNGEPYIHLNNYSPYNSIFDSVWDELQTLVNKGIKIILMIGGAGGAFGCYQKNVSVYYEFLKELIDKKKHIISGVDLDVEEQIKYNLIKELVINLKHDFGADFTISFAPVSYAIEEDIVGMGGFYYKQLQQDLGILIDYYNTQFYYDYNDTSYHKAIENGYDPSKIIFGAISNIPLQEQIDNVTKLYHYYGDTFGGVFIWEYVDAPNEWSKFMCNIIT